MEHNTPKLDNVFLFLSHTPCLSSLCSAKSYSIEPSTMNIFQDFLYSTTMIMFQYSQEWLPHKLDALGFISLLGAKEMDVAIGSLITNDFTDRLPLLSGHVILNSRIMESAPGFTLYNMSDGINAVNVTGWFCRWLLSQQLTWNLTLLNIQAVSEKQVSNCWSKLWSLKCHVIGTVAMGVMILMSVLTEDQWALMNALAFFVSVKAQHIIVRQFRTGIDKQIDALSNKKDANQLCKSMLVTPFGHTVMLQAPRAIITEVILTNPKTPSQSIYHIARILGWVGFGVHAICLGMSTLVNQIAIVVVLLTSTLITAYYMGADHQNIGSRLQIKRHNLNGELDSRLEACIEFKLNHLEEENLELWGELPSRSNDFWWKRYQRRIAETRDE